MPLPPEASQAIAAALPVGVDFLTQSRDWLMAEFGPLGVAGAAIATIVLAFLLAMKIIELAFKLLLFVALPAAGLSFLGGLFLPDGFAQLLPVCAAFCLVVFLVKS